MDTHAPAPGPGRGWSGTVFCGVSLDGFIARTDGDIDWLEAPVPAGQAAPSGSGAEAVPDFEALVARGLDDSHFDAVVENLAATLKELGVGDDLIGEVALVAESVRPDVLGQ